MAELGITIGSFPGSFSLDSFAVSALLNRHGLMKGSFRAQLFRTRDMVLSFHKQPKPLVWALKNFFCKFQTSGICAGQNLRSFRRSHSRPLGIVMGLKLNPQP